MWGALGGVVLLALAASTGSPASGPGNLEPPEAEGTYAGVCVDVVGVGAGVRLGPTSVLKLLEACSCERSEATEGAFEDPSEPGSSREPA